MASNAIEEAVIALLRQLASEKQQDVLDFANSLRAKTGERPHLKSVRGLCANLGFRISEEEISEARKEMWGQFPRERFFG